MIEAEDYSKTSKRGEYKYVFYVMGMSYNSLLSTETGAACMSFEVTNC